MTTDAILQLTVNFETRNNISTYMKLYSDGSWTMYEFWEDEELKEGKNFDDLKSFLQNTQYLLADDGRCLSPIQVAE